MDHYFLDIQYLYTLSARYLYKMVYTLSTCALKFAIWSLESISLHRQQSFSLIFLHKPSIISFLVYFSKHVPLCICALSSKLPFNKSIGIYTIWPKLITHSYLFSRLMGSRISQFQFRTKKQHIFYLSQISFSFCYIFCYSLCKPYS